MSFLVWLAFQDTSHAAELKARMLPLWKLFLLNQFHDVLPGSCIEMVTIATLDKAPANTSVGKKFS